MLNNKKPEDQFHAQVYHLHIKEHSQKSLNLYLKHRNPKAFAFLKQESVKNINM